MPKSTQSFSHHTRWHTPYHFVLSPILFIHFAWCILRVTKAPDAGSFRTIIVVRWFVADDVDGARQSAESAGSHHSTGRTASLPAIVVRRSGRQSQRFAGSIYCGHAICFGRRIAPTGSTGGGWRICHAKRIETGDPKLARRLLPCLKSAAVAEITEYIDLRGH